MKTIKLIARSAGVVFAALSVHAQTIQNLNFEQANPVFVNPILFPGFVTTMSALPHWTVTIGGVPQTQITENGPSAGSTWVSLVGPGSDDGIVPLDGNYSVLLQGGVIPGDAAISQTGLIPHGTQTLLFEAQPEISPPSAPLDFLVGTQDVPFTAVGTGPNYTLYSANISAWAHLTEQLTFSVPGSAGNWEIDDISFSQSAVPEPSIIALAAIGSLLFVARKRQHVADP